MINNLKKNPRPIRGYSSISIDGNNFIHGDSVYGRIYRSSDDAFDLLFETDEGPVHSLLNLENNVNLASIGNKLYLIHCGEIDIEEINSEEDDDIESPTTTSTTTNAIINIVSPNGGDVFVLGEEITISWTSSLGISEAIKLDLYKGDELVSQINPQTSNDGSYVWEIPFNLVTGDDYKVQITRLTAGESLQTDISDNFSIVTNTTTTSTTTMASDSVQSTAASVCRGIPILHFGLDEYITDMIKDESSNRILFITSKARVLSSNQIDFNAYLTGERNVYAKVKNGFGIVSHTTSVSFLYALYNKIAEINSNKEIVKWKFEETASVNKNDRIEATFLSPILNVKEDLGFWKELLWREEKPDNTEILICIRTGSTLSEMQNKPWDDCFISRESDKGYGSSGIISRDLLNIDLKGQYLQFKIVMSSARKNISPYLLDLNIVYSTKFALYFFTTKFNLKNDANAKKGLLIASITEPLNTEIRFGVTDINSSDWNDYKVISTDEFFNLNDFENIKAGIKMISYGDNVPEVAEFSLISGAEKHSEINR